MFPFKKKYQMDDLTSLMEGFRFSRKDFRIAIIEDEHFPPLEHLQNHGFNIVWFKDIEKLFDISDFAVIICDIRGVGKNFGSNLEGAHLIQEINKQFPQKYLIACSNSTFDMALTKYFSLCNEALNKKIDVHDWVIALDKALKCYNDPVVQWEKTRRILRTENIPINQISNLEKAFIKSLI